MEHAVAVLRVVAELERLLGVDRDVEDLLPGIITHQRIPDLDQVTRARKSLHLHVLVDTETARGAEVDAEGGAEGIEQCHVDSAQL